MKDSILETGITQYLSLEKQTQNKALAGLRVAVKDLFNIAGVVTAAGNPSWQKSHPIPLITSDVVNNLLNANAKVIGKSLTDELAYSLNGINQHFGTPINHSAPNRIPGGSSSGSAVAVASGVADIGLGTDTGGSIRVPSSYNGLFGIRPSHGVIQETQMVSLAPSFDTVGWMTKNLDTLIKVANQLYPETINREIRNVEELIVLKPTISGHTIGSLLMDQSIEQLKDHFNIKILNLNDLFFENASHAFRVLQGAEIWQEHGKWILEENPKFAADIAERFKWCSTIDAKSIEKANTIRQEVSDFLKDVIPENALMLMPTTPGAAPLLNADTNWMKNYRTQLMGLTSLSGLSRRPQVHLPVLTDQDSPWGLSLVGHYEQDFNLLGTAERLFSIWREHLS
ncbi:amidase [Thiomicrorhabdus indica]|uniref:amidase n=1 Tax=Thiomicrorhabdus indica TaxID=2267253 RepID=UPI002AA94265|nr:amidase [Thiomicrorhabdus indica]